jgi:LytS/YehU family sensor histidine kinase
MRYNVKDEGDGRAMLEDEVQHLKNYIEMNQLRFNHALQIHLQVSGTLQYRMVMPLVLLTFVENCFKHGELFDPANPLIIRIDVEDDRMLFYTSNKKRNEPREVSTGIGLVNIRKRLDLHCLNRYVLDIKEDATHYTCTLVINL